MNRKTKNDMFSKGRIFTLLATGLVVAACGGGGGDGDQVAGIGGTGIVAGPITGFGSVWVNGRELEIDMAEIEVDGTGGKIQDDLKLGMVVTLEVKTENGEFTNEATRVIYDDEIEGPFDSVPMEDPLDPTIKTGVIFGQTINFSDTTTVYSGTSFESLGAENNAGIEDVVEISGFRTASGINATYVEFKGDLNPDNSEVELRGTMNFSGGSTFTVGVTTVNILGGTVFDTPGNVPADGLYVEVKGVFKTGGSVDALRVEEEDEDFDDEVDDISVQGIVSGFATGGISDFKVGSQRVDASGVLPVPALADGMKIEVEGEIVGGVLFPDEVELREEDSKLRSFIGNVDLASGTFEVNYTAAGGKVIVHVDGDTLFEDDTLGPLVTPPFSLDDLNANVDFVRVEGIEFDDPATLGDDVHATYVRRVDPNSPAEFDLEGLVDTYDKDVSITVLGVTYGIDAGTTDFDPVGLEDSIVPGTTFVEIEDKANNDVNPPGTADKIGLED